MNNINRLLLCITLISSQFILHAEDLNTQINSETNQETPIITDRAATNPQNILNTINNIVNIAQSANSFINQMNPTDTTTTKTGQQAATAQEQEKIDTQNILDTVETVVGIVGTANDFIDQIIPTDEPAGNDQQVIDIISASEIEKWQYVNNYFTASIGDLNSYEKIGDFISQNAKYLAMPMAVLYKFLAEQVLTKVTPADTSTTPQQNSSKALRRSIKAGSNSIKYITAPIIGGLLTYKLFKFISTKIGTKKTKYNAALINFAKDWENHKNMTPEILWSLFENLNKDLIDNNGKLEAIDAALAQKVIEAIATNASVYNYSAQ